MAEQKQQQQQQVVKTTQTPITEMVISKVKELEAVQGINLPTDYSVVNAVRSAYLIISQMTNAKTNVPVLQEVSRESVYQAMFNMVSQGLNPAKKQCSFIQYGKSLFMQREYAGSIALAKRYSGMKAIHAGVIYEGDNFEYAIDTMTGRKTVIKHEQPFDNIDESKIKGSYAIKIFEDGSVDTEIMTIAQIKKSWGQGPTKGESPAHKNFPSEMAKKTVINRACKLLIAASDDSVLLEPWDDGRPLKPEPIAALPASTEPVEPIQVHEVIDIPEPEPEPIPEPVNIPIEPIKEKKTEAKQTKAPF